MSKIGLLLIVPLVLSYVLTYQLGKKVSYEKVHNEWNNEKQATRAKIAELEQEYQAYEFEYKKTIEDLVTQLQNSQDSFDSELVRIRNVYSDRLLNSEERASIYQRQAESGASERRSLADHAARLDKSLEEGRYLVRELGATLRQREREISVLSEQIQADRQLLYKAEMIND